MSNVEMDVVMVDASDGKLIGITHASPEELSLFGVASYQGSLWLILATRGTEMAGRAVVIVVAQRVEDQVSHRLTLNEEAMAEVLNALMKDEETP